jgi:hypothetical protein
LEISNGFDVAGRVRDGQWTLKFTRDSQPVLTCQFDSIALDIYYQYFSSECGRGNMPDVAVRIKSTGKWLFILDQKSGMTFRERELAEVCIRYANAFQPDLSCVANYFPDQVRRSTLSHPTPAIIYHGLRPATVRALDRDIQIVLSKAAIATNSVRIAVLLDVSSSTSSVHEKLDDVLRQEVMLVSTLDLTGSVVVLFNSDLIEKITLENYLAGKRHHVTEGGTDYRAALEEGVRQLGSSLFKRELWLVGDGGGSFESGELLTRCVELGICVRAYIADPSIHVEMKSLCDHTGGQYTKI